MSKFLARRPLLALSLGLTAGLLLGVGMLVGALVASSAQRAPALAIPETLLHASASHGGDSFAMATGLIDEGMEGLFVLDYATGDLQCFAISPRNFQFCMQVKYNVIGDLGLEQGKKPTFVMVTGSAAFLRGASTLAPAGSVVYVADAHTGNFAAYGIVFDRTSLKTGIMQPGLFKLLGRGQGKAPVERE